MTVFDYHTAIDKAIGQAMANTAADQQPCCKRCTNPHCCSEPAYADAREVDSMLDMLTPEQRSHVVNGTERWRSVFAVNRMMNDELPSAFPYRLLNLPCPFLKDGRCLVYERRPFGCREFFALGNPEDCAMPARIYQKFAAFPHPNRMDMATFQFAANQIAELDHISGHLVRKLLGDSEFTTAAHQRFEITTD